MKIKQRPVKPGGAGKLEKVPGRRKAGGCPEGSKKKLKAKAKESLRPPVPGGPSPPGPPSSLFGGSDPRLLGPRDEGARLGERGKKGTRKSKGLQAALRVSGAGLGAPLGLGGGRFGICMGWDLQWGVGHAGLGLLGGSSEMWVQVFGSGCGVLREPWGAEGWGQVLHRFWVLVKLRGHPSGWWEALGGLGSHRGVNGGP